MFLAFVHLPALEKNKTATRQAVHQAPAHRYHWTDEPSFLGSQYNSDLSLGRNIVWRSRVVIGTEFSSFGFAQPWSSASGRFGMALCPDLVTFRDRSLGRQTAGYRKTS